MELLVFKTLANAGEVITKQSWHIFCPFPRVLLRAHMWAWWMLEPVLAAGGVHPFRSSSDGTPGCSGCWGLKLCPLLTLSPPDFQLPAVPGARGNLMCLPLTIAETEANYRWCLPFRIIKLIRKMQPSSCEDVVFCSWWDCVLPAAFVHCPETARSWKKGKNILLEKEPA